LVTGYHLVSVYDNNWTKIIANSVQCTQHEQRKTKAAELAKTKPQMPASMPLPKSRKLACASR